jgi:hypothetical protein
VSSSSAYVVAIPVKVRREGVTDYHLEPPTHGEIKITVDADSEEEALQLVSLMLAMAATQAYLDTDGEVDSFGGES